VGCSGCGGVQVSRLESHKKKCHQLATSPTKLMNAFVAYEGTDLAQYVIDTNTTRRNLTTSQRAMATALVLKADGRRENGRWKRNTGLGHTQQMLDMDNEGSWAEYLRRCGIVLDWADDMAQRVGGLFVEAFPRIASRPGLKQ
jgi:hypothetical protein